MKLIFKQLESCGYIQNDIERIFQSPSYEGIPYTDGDEPEKRIFDAIATTRDLSVFSPELQSHCTDWASLYHLSSSRANILRPIADQLKGDILEIGAGCGAITRFLGETGANVLALEGSLRRSQIARSRTRDLSNVAIIAESFADFKIDHQFDVITLIGVLEYATIFIPGSDPATAMLARIRQLLKPDGLLCIAIENQFGLKYFEGAAEDHIGIPMYGIEGRYSSKQPQTYGRRALAEKIHSAGFQTSEFFSCFPDYKIPLSIITEEGLEEPTFDAAVLAWQSVTRDPQYPEHNTFSSTLAWPGIFANNLALELSNSFLVVASPRRPKVTPPRVLAYHYSTNRLSHYCKETRFERAQDGTIAVRYHLLHPIDDRSGLLKDCPLSFVVPSSGPYTRGTPLALDFVRTITRDGWTYDDVGSFIRRYFGLLDLVLRSAGERPLVLQPDTIIPGRFYDCLPQNIIVRADGSPTFIDTEWRLASDLSLNQLLFRALLFTTGTTCRFGRHASGMRISRADFIKNSAAAVGFSFKDVDLLAFADFEEKLQRVISGRCSNESPTRDALQDHLPYGNYLASITLRDQMIGDRDRVIIESNSVIAERDGQIAQRDVLIAQRDALIAQRDGTIAERNERIAARDEVIAALRVSLDSIIRSKKWRLINKMTSMVPSFVKTAARLLVSPLLRGKHD